MLVRHSHVYAATFFVFLTLLPYIRTEATVTSSETSQDSSVAVVPTCPARTINYITQTLPQQCLRTGWTEDHASKHEISGIEGADSPAESLIVWNKEDTLVPAQDEESNIHKPAPEGATLTAPHPSQTTINPEYSERALAESSPAAVAHPEAEPASDGDSPLDNAYFLSFEDWKKQNLARAGQSAESLEKSRTQAGDSETRRMPSNINNALDSLGEDVEIEIDFGGFVNPSAERHLPSHAQPDAEQASENEKASHGKKRGGGPGNDIPKSKDAGTTCKERFNYASFDCAATVLKTNPECRGSTSVLVENKDSYMLNKCSADNKFFIVELCNDILVDTVVLANFEFFSSMFRSFKVSVSDRYPVRLDRWKELGTFVARNSREVQAFAIDNPLIWARYLRIEFLTHFGNEYYCPVSLLRVHGTTMIEEFRHESEAVLEDEDFEEAVAKEHQEENQAQTVVDAVLASVQSEIRSQPRPEEEERDVALGRAKSAEKQVQPSDMQAPDAVNPQADKDFTCRNKLPDSPVEEFRIIFARHNVDRQICGADENEAAVGASMTGTGALKEAKVVHGPSVAASESADASTSSLRVGDDIPAIPSNTESPGFSVTHDSESKAHPSSLSSSVSSSYSAVQSSPGIAKTSTSSTQPPAANPTTQESFFKSIHKRLQLLESNSTLSLQYIEEQSRILRDAFAKVEKRQLAKTTTFLESLNATVLGELREFRQQYDQIWQSTVLELSSQREQSQREVLDLSTRLSLLADEILFQKRMVVLQFVLILFCLGLVIFSRSTNSAGVGYLELPPIVSNMVNRSSQSISRYATFESPPTSPPSTRPSSRYGLFSRGSGHDRNRSDASTINIDSEESIKRPVIDYSPPTPNSVSVASPSPTASDGSEAEVVPRGTKSSPATPSGKRAKQNPLEHQQTDYSEDGMLSPRGGARKTSPSRASSGEGDTDAQSWSHEDSV